MFCVFYLSSWLVVNSGHRRLNLKIDDIFPLYRNKATGATALCRSGYLEPVVNRC